MAKRVNGRLSMNANSEGGTSLVLSIPHLPPTPPPAFTSIENLPVDYTGLVAEGTLPDDFTTFPSVATDAICLFRSESWAFLLNPRATTPPHPLDDQSLDALLAFNDADIRDLHTNVGLALHNSHCQALSAIAMTVDSATNKVPPDKDELWLASNNLRLALLAEQKIVRELAHRLIDYGRRNSRRSPLLLQSA